MRGPVMKLATRQRNGTMFTDGYSAWDSEKLRCGALAA